MELLFVCTSIFVTLLKFKDTQSEMHSIHRASCRRDALFELTDRGKRLSGIPTVAVLSVTSRAICVRNCLRRVSCLSTNFRSTGNNENNCELVDLNKSNSSAVLTTSTGWDHYEPVNQVYHSIYCISLFSKIIETYRNAFAFSDKKLKL